MKKMCLILLLLFSCRMALFSQEQLFREKAPDKFSVRFETSRGIFDAEILRDLSPLGVDRFWQLVNHRFFDNALFYRVVPNFVAQFGNTDSAELRKWVKNKVPDEKVAGSNLKGTISYARDGKDTRGEEMFINLKDNLRLDTTNYQGVRGFPVIGKVTAGMDVVESLFSVYGDKTMEKLDLMYLNRKKFLEQFYGLDSIKKAFIINNSQK